MFVNANHTRGFQMTFFNCRQFFCCKVFNYSVVLILFVLESYSVFNCYEFVPEAGPVLLFTGNYLIPPPAPVWSRQQFKTQPPCKVIPNKFPILCNFCTAALFIQLCTRTAGLYTANSVYSFTAPTFF